MASGRVTLDLDLQQLREANAVVGPQGDEPPALRRGEGLLHDVHRLQRRAARAPAGLDAPPAAGADGGPADEPGRVAPAAGGREHRLGRDRSTWSSATERPASSSSTSRARRSRTSPAAGRSASKAAVCWSRRSSPRRSDGRPRPGRSPARCRSTPPCARSRSRRSSTARSARPACRLSGRSGGVPGPDVIVGDLTGLAQFGSRSGTQVGLAVGTDSCNAGVGAPELVRLPNNDHPVIPQNLYRMSGGATNDERFEQIGQSNVKHAFTALTAEPLQLRLQRRRRHAARGRVLRPLFGQPELPARTWARAPGSTRSPASTRAGFQTPNQQPHRPRHTGPLAPDPDGDRRPQHDPERRRHLLRGGAVRHAPRVCLVPGESRPVQHVQQRLVPPVQRHRHGQPVQLLAGGPDGADAAGHHGLARRDAWSRSSLSPASTASRTSPTR